MTNVQETKVYKLFAEVLPGLPAEVGPDYEYVFYQLNIGDGIQLDFAMSPDEIYLVIDGKSYCLGEITEDNAEDLIKLVRRYLITNENLKR